MMKIKHVGLAVKRPDVESFYKDILGFESLKNFRVDGADVSKIFGLLGSVDVEIMRYDSIDFELFISGCGQFITFTHVCIETSKAQEIFKKATDAGFSGFERKNGARSTWFIRDSAGNLFELKAH
jgi:catechol 2,3-dioxygenase-like lactoylglutathione lyase family enzyme